MTPPVYQETEGPFEVNALSIGEATRLSTLCSFIVANRSGPGICNSCKVGAQQRGDEADLRATATHHEDIVTTTPQPRLNSLNLNPTLPSSLHLTGSLIGLHARQLLPERAAAVQTAALAHLQFQDEPAVVVADEPAAPAFLAQTRTKLFTATARIYLARNPRCG